jgi:predicted dehydrogenase
VRPLRLGIIGTGVAARILHWPALQQLPDRYQIVAAANRSRDKGLAFADLVGLDRSAVYTDYRQMLARDDLDVVDLLLPPHLNYPVARAAAKAGLHVICEKPIAATLGDARAMVDLAAEFGVQVLIAENFRYENAVRKARALIDEGAIAAPHMLSYQWLQPVAPDDEIASRPWRQNPAHAGGIMTDHGVHMIDVVRYLMGEVTEVQAFALDLRDDLGGSDSAVYNLKFESGALGSIQWSFCVASELQTRIQLWAGDGTLEVTLSEVRLKRAGRADKVHPASGSSSFYNEFQDFYGVLVEGTPPLVTPADALCDLEAVLAAHRSSLSGQVEILRCVQDDEVHQP